MKTAIAKYLPVEGTPELEDFYIDNSGILGLDGLSVELLDKGYKKIKFFAVTQDIETGDEVFGDDVIEEPFNDGWGEFFRCIVLEKREKTFFLSTGKKSGLTKFETKHDNCYKILGELSPNAAWVKEGDEIKGEIDLQSGTRPAGYLFRVLCPTCNTYH